MAGSLPHERLKNCNEGYRQLQGEIRQLQGQVASLQSQLGSCQQKSGNG